MVVVRAAVVGVTAVVVRMGGVGRRPGVHRGVRFGRVRSGLGCDVVQVPDREGEAFVRLRTMSPLSL